MCEGSQNGIEDAIQFFGQIFGQESQDKEAVLLEEGIFPSVSTVRFSALQVLGPVQLDDQTCISAKKVDLHLANTIEGDIQFDIQLEAPSCVGKGLEAAQQKNLGGAPGFFRALAAGCRRMSRLDKEIGERSVDAILDQPSNTG